MSKNFEVFSLIFLFILVSLLLIFSTQKQEIKSLVQFFGLFAFFLLSLSLIIGPLIVIWPKHFTNLLDFRKAIGVGAFIIILGHFFLIMENYFNWDLTRAAAAPGIIGGLLSFFILFILTITSFNFFYHSLGQKVWKGIHYFNYIAFIFAFYHFLLKAPSGKKQILDYSFLEFFLILFGILTIILQIIGFLIRLKRKSS